jgi:hypothetical protein
MKSPANKTAHACHLRDMHPEAHENLRKKDSPRLHPEAHENPCE